MSIDFPCVCGHPKSIHEKGGKPDQYVCYFFASDGLDRRCHCFWFEADNLRYLESLIK